MSDLASVISEMNGAAAAYLEGLGSEAREKTTQPFDEVERRKWYYTPTPRAGLPLLEMTPRQQQSVLKLMATGLSEAGYNHAAVVLGEEYIVDHHSHFPDRTYGDLAGTRVRDPGNYCVAIYGTPGDEDGWGWRVGGHHLSLCYTVKGASISPTPAFFGAEPSRVKMAGGVEMRPLAAEEDLARAIVTGLDADSRARAILSLIPPTDIVQMNRPRVEDGAIYQIGGNGPGGQGLRDKLGLTPEHDEILRYSTTPKGLPAREMDAGQRETLAKLVSVYFEHLAEAIRAQYASLLDPERLDGMSFAWAGPTEYASPHYYRIQGERLLIEYDCTQDDANHTHTVWRDPSGDFGEDILGAHYAAAHR
jgi:hypothetical protein